MSTKSSSIWGAVAALVGICGGAYLVFHIGLHAVTEAVLSVGWRGFALLCLYGCLNFALLGAAWLAVAPPYTLRRAAIFWWGRAVRDSVGDVLPLSQFGGMVIGARAATLCGVSTPAAYGSTVVDITVEMIAQLVFIIASLVILFMHLPNFMALPLAKGATVGVCVALALATLFVAVQRRSFSFLQRIARTFLPSAESRIGDLDDVISATYAVPSRLAAGATLHMIGWLSAAFGTWLSLKLIGHPLAFSGSIAIEGLLCAMRSAAIVVPAAIGVQEAGYAMMLPLLGVPAELGLAVSILKRAREIALAVPVLLSWQVAEGKFVLRPRGAGTK